MDRTRRWYWPIILGSLVGPAIALIATRYMRLIGDDYIVAADQLTLGFVGAFEKWINHYAGALSLVEALAFGWWAGTQPYSVGYLPFVLIMLLLPGLTLAVLVSWITRTRDRPLMGAVFLAGSSLWLLSIGNLFPRHDLVVLFGHLNFMVASYRITGVYQALLTLGIVAILLTRYPKAALALAAISGLVLPLRFTSLLPDLLAYVGVAAVLGILLAVWHRRASRTGFSSGAWASWLFAIGAALGTASLVFSPGFRNRRAQYGFEYDYQYFFFDYSQQLWVYIRELMNVSNGIVFLGAIAMGALLIRTTPADLTIVMRRTQLLAVTTLLMTVALVLSGSSTVVFSYAAVWHRWGMQTFFFFFVLAFGLIVGYRVAKTIRSMAVWASILAVASLASSVPAVGLLRLEQERLLVWETGQPAPMDYIWDREAWGDYWIQLENARRSAGIG